MHARLGLVGTLLIASLATLIAGGCQTTPDKPAAEETPAAVTARDYFPLAVGNRWVYRTEPAPEGAELAEVSIVAQESPGTFRDNHGTRLQARVDGVFDGDRFLLEDPVELGHKWMAVPSASAMEEYEVVKVDLEHGVPAGHFSGCIRVRATQEGRTADGKPMRMQMLWTYAPGVGLIELEQLVQLKGQPARRVGRRQLVEYKLGSDESGADKPGEGKGGADG